MPALRARESVRRILSAHTRKQKLIAALVLAAVVVAEVRHWHTDLVELGAVAVLSIFGIMGIRAHRRRKVVEKTKAEQPK